LGLVEQGSRVDEDVDEVGTGSALRGVGGNIFRLELGDLGVCSRTSVDNSRVCIHTHSFPQVVVG
jgi:hypothetical protein